MRELSKAATPSHVGIVAAAVVAIRAACRPRWPLDHLDGSVHLAAYRVLRPVRMNSTAPRLGQHPSADPALVYAAHATAFLLPENRGGGAVVEVFQMVLAVAAALEERPAVQLAVAGLLLPDLSVRRLQSRTHAGTLGSAFAAFAQKSRCLRMQSRRVLSAYFSASA